MKGTNFPAAGPFAEFVLKGGAEHRLVGNYRSHKPWLDSGC